MPKDDTEEQKSKTFYKMVVEMAWQKAVQIKSTEMKKKRESNRQSRIVCVCV